MQEQHPPPSFAPPKLKYNPRRITPAGSVLRPLTEAEAATWVSQNPLRNLDRKANANANATNGHSTNGGSKEVSQLGKRSRDSQENAGPTPDQPPAKRSKDVGLIVQHCKSAPPFPSPHLTTNTPALPTRQRPTRRRNRAPSTIRHHRPQILQQLDQIRPHRQIRRPRLSGLFRLWPTRSWTW